MLNILFIINYLYLSIDETLFRGSGIEILPTVPVDDRAHKIKINRPSYNFTFVFGIK
jgi:hypothetical protein